MILILVLITPAEVESAGVNKLVIEFRIVCIPDAKNVPAVETNRLDWKS
jgi:hypothetical protein